jgi:hypothetical protein
LLLNPAAQPIKNPLQLSLKRVPDPFSRIFKAPASWKNKSALNEIISVLK